MRTEMMIVEQGTQDAASGVLPSSRAFSLKRRTVGLLASVAFFWAALPPLPAFAQALPTGGAVSSGAASIATGSSSVTVTQSSPTAIVNWNSFSIGQGGAVRFENGAGATLNRVTGFSPSQIDGALSASGSVYLVNPSGITVGPSGIISTGGSFIASTHDVSDAAFHAGGALTFKGGSTASVINYGSIGSLGGDVALIARKVENAGTITAPNGTVALAAGYEVLMRDAALSDGKFVVKVGGADTEAKTSGVIKAAEVELRANGGNIYALAGNTDSLTKATGVASKGGRVFLTAGDSGKVELSQRVVARAAPVGGKAKGGEIRVAGGTAKITGKLDAKGEGAAGGTVVVTGRDITLASGAVLDASGTTGGTVLVGGDFQGGASAVRYLAETLATAQNVTVADGASIRADGSAGAGGKVVVWSDQRTSFAGVISARGAGSAAGGDAEVSGKAWLDYRGSADLRSDSGAFGTLLLDPYNLTISSAASSGMSGFNANADDSVLNVTTLTNALATANVTLTTGSGGGQAGDITVANAVSWTSGSTLTLQAAGGIALNADVTAASGGLTLYAGGAITASGAISVGRFTLQAGNWTQNSASLPGFAAKDFRITGGSFLRAAGGNGSSGNPYVLTDIYGVQGMGSSAAYRAASYSLDRDIDATGTASWNSGSGFNPVGSNGANFTGTFDGGGHVISGLTINRPTTDYVGLFGNASGATLRNVGLVGGSVAGHDYVGGLLGAAFVSGTVSNAYATGTVSGNYYVGGLVGATDGAVSNAYATGAVSGALYVGGLAGAALGTTSNVYATGAVSGISYIGGLIGAATGMLSNAYATGAVSGFQAVGGLLGGTEGVVSNTYATGAVSGSLYVGGLIGYNGGTVSTSYWDQGSSGSSTAVGRGFNSGITAVTSAGGSPTAFSASAYASFDFTNTWFMVEGSTRPFLRSEWSTTITNAHQLQLMSMNLGATYTLAKDIDLSVVQQAGQMWKTATGFAPVGIGASTFTGSFDGAGHVISNLYINRPSTNYVGLFGYVENATLRNVGLVGGSVTGYENVGSLAGGSDNTTISNVYATGAVSGSSLVGGLVGQVFMSSIRDAYTTGAVTGTSYYVGGIAGSLSVSSLTNAYATGAVSGGSDVGGLAGQVISNSTITNAYASGRVTGSNAGGLVGKLEIGSSITNGYWDVDTSGQNSGVGTGVTTGTTGIYSAVGGSQSAFAQATYAGFDFGTDWFMVDGSMRPFLRSEWSATITNANQLQLMAMNLGASYTLGKDIDLSVIQTSPMWNSGGFSPVGNTTAYFTGTFDGAGHVISNLTINRPSTDNVGLFGATSGATLRDVGLTGGSVTAQSMAGPLVGLAVDTSITNAYATGGTTTGLLAGGLVGRMNGGSIRNSYATGNVTGTHQLGGLVGIASGTSISGSYATGSVQGSGNYVGGLVGIAENGTITDAYATGTVSGGFFVGGLVGINRGTVSNAYATGTVSGSYDYLGGLVGYNTGTVSNAYAIGAVSGTGNGSYYVGGLVGDNSGTVSNAYATGAVSGYFYVGGLAGENYGTVSNAYATGAVSGNRFVGGLVGYGDLGTITNSFWNTQTTGQGTSSGGGGGLTTAQMRDLSIFTAAGWDIDDAGGTGKVWRIYDGQTGPMLRSFMKSLTVTAGDVTKTYDGATFSGGSATTYTGFVNGDSVASLSGMLIYGGTAQGAKNAGSYFIAPTGQYSGQQGYDITYVSGVLTVNKAALTVTADGQSRTYGDSNPALTYTTSGLVSGDSLSGALAAPSQTASVGTYGITQGTLDNANYDITYVGANLTVSRAALTITADNAGKTYDGLAYTGGNGLSYSGFVNGEGASVLGGSLAYGGSAQNAINAGSYVITASGLTSGNYDITYVAGSLTVGRAALTITANNAGKTYDGLAFSGGNGVAYSGFVNGETSSVLSGSLVYGGTSQGAVNAGSYGITASGLTSSNYDISYAGGTLTVDRAALTITANNASKIYDGSAYTGGNGVTYSGFVNGETSSVLGGAIDYSGTSQNAVNAGAYAIRASGQTSSNYDISYVSGALNVGQRAITVTADAKSRIYGDANPALTYTVGGMGLVGSDSLSGALAGAAVTAGVGVYGITQGTLANANYAIAYTGADLTITPRAITVTADAQSRSYGDANSALTYTLGGMGLVNGDSLSGALANNANATSGIGTYAITQGSLTANANYAMTYTGGNLTIIPRAITVTADAQNRYYGEVNPSLTYKVGGLGLVNGDELSGALATDATATSVAGIYQITQGTLAANANYALTYVAGALTVTDPPRIIALNEIVAPNDFGQTLFTQNALRFLNLMTPTIPLPDTACDAGRSCPLTPVASNLPTSPWLRFGSQ